MRYVAVLLLLVCYMTANSDQDAVNRMARFYQAAGYAIDMNNHNKALLDKCGSLFPELKSRATQTRRKWVSRNKVYINKADIIINDSVAMMRKKKGSKAARVYAERLDQISAGKNKQLIDRVSKLPPVKQRNICMSVIKLSDSGQLDIRLKNQNLAAILERY